MSYARSIFLTVLLMGTSFGVAAQQNPAVNRFFGFEAVLLPLAIKWQCGGDRENDLAQLDAMGSAYPEDAEGAGLPVAIEAMQGVSGISELIERELTPDQTEILCAGALPLHLDWMTPEIWSADSHLMATEIEQISRSFVEIAGSL
ncbi:hypothetical protein [Gymnodinialimonas ulvae]|uniref:hypothetical protein n=1 Tax=Gymnodinialimonas ulvae TaxID=3126504 RepID=UPI0030A3A197